MPGNTAIRPRALARAAVADESDQRRGGSAQPTWTRPRQLRPKLTAPQTRAPPRIWRDQLGRHFGEQRLISRRGPTGERQVGKLGAGLSKETLEQPMHAIVVLQASGP